MTGKAWRRYPDYAFAAGQNLVLLLLVAAELAQVVPAMLLGFVQIGESFQLMAVTALRPGANLFAAPDGQWLGAYVPAALRGYLFRLVKPKTARTPFFVSTRQVDWWWRQGRANPDG